MKKNKEVPDTNLNVDSFSPEIIELPNVLNESSGAYYDNEFGDQENVLNSL